ncbi:unnamed protein product [Acanthoscelides obtectus]|uniref:Uncharacterized protein n=1 Tax=Acanthoscelides obtectus TaxID=200917 RepID=A0A9P0JYM2_ACAOB|nr:unnamed protein product [Acanthoscelides obtectus]CAK1647928.1 hypothetical protein AOBTE_LOCUS15459 [Acanthoscelides obtectus]
MSPIYLLKDIDVKVNYLNELLLNIFDFHAPIRTVRISRKRSPWLTYNLKQMMKLRDKALRKYHRTKNHNDWLGYNTLKNKINHAINKEKQVYFEQQVALNKNRMWKELGKLNIVNKKQNSLPQHLGTANQINNFFMQSISGDNNEPDQYTLRFFSDTQLPHEAFEFSYTNDNEVYQKLLSVKSTAVGADGASVNVGWALVDTGYVEVCRLGRVSPDTELSCMVAVMFKLNVLLLLCTLNESNSLLVSVSSFLDCDLGHFSNVEVCPVCLQRVQLGPSPEKNILYVVSSNAIVVDYDFANRWCNIHLSLETENVIVFIFRHSNSELITPELKRRFGNPRIPREIRMNIERILQTKEDIEVGEEEKLASSVQESSENMYVKCNIGYK